MSIVNYYFELFKLTYKENTNFEEVDFDYDFNPSINSIEKLKLKANIEVIKRRNPSNGELKFHLLCEIESDSKAISFIINANYNSKIKGLTVSILRTNFELVLNDVDQRTSFMSAIKIIYDQFEEMIKKDENLRIIFLLNGLKFYYDHDFSKFINNIKKSV